MPVTRSHSSRKEESSTAESSTVCTSNTATTTTTTGSGATETSATTTSAANASATGSERPATPPPQETSVVTVVRQVTSQPATLRPRSHHSKASRKRFLAELEAKERLAEAQQKEAQAAAELAKVKLMRIQAEDSSDEEDEDIVDKSERIEQWVQEQSSKPPPPALALTAGHARGSSPVRGQTQAPPTPWIPTEPPRVVEAPQHEERAPPERQQEKSSSEDVTQLAALFKSVLSGGGYREPPRYIQDLPTFNGNSSEWLPFRAAYHETEKYFTKIENVARLRKSLRGAALDAVSCLLISDPNPVVIIQGLERRFGRPEALILNELDKVKKLPKLAESPRDLCIFASKLANIVATIEALKKPHFLYNPEIERTAIEKLTPILRDKWYEYNFTQHGEEANLKKLSTYLNHEADKCGPYAALEQINNSAPTPVSAREKAAKKKTERTYAAENTHKEEEDGCPMCKQAHKLPECTKFNEKTTDERWEIAKQNKMCFRCLRSTHRRFTCKAKPCGVSGCNLRHHKLLHHEAAKKEEKHEEVTASTTEKPTVAANKSERRRAYLKIAPVVLTGPHSSIETYALFDEGSTITIIDADVANSLGLDGPTDPMWVQGVSGKEVRHSKSKKVDFTIRGKHAQEEFKLEDARTVEKLDFITQTVKKEEVDDCSHLSDIQEELAYEGASPKLLIGQDNWDLIVSREVRDGRRDQPVASRTQLGWVLHGCRTTQSKPINFCGHVTSAEESMEKMMKHYFELESLGIEARKPTTDPEEQATRKLEEESRRLPDGRFETRLLWKQENEKIPNNRQDALKRLCSLERKLDRDPELKKKYEERMENMLKSGYAEPATTLPTQDRTWYLPHFAVCNPEKKKIRLVHDAAAKSHGRSLNDMLLTGPDLLQSLPGVVMRFRQHPYAVSADIKEMFMQIRIKECDRDALRFLWRGDRREGTPDEYRMTSVIFGASSSPCTALFIKNRNARDFADTHPEAVRAIEKNHYMDDYLQSFMSVEEAQHVTKTVDEIHRQAGFELRGWASNERRVLRDLVTDAETATIDIGGSEIEKTLGLMWHVHEDNLGFRLNTHKTPAEVLRGDRPPSKREALSVIMSLYDPLGWISPVTTPAKRIMQDSWRYGTSWDDPIPEELQSRWHNWLSNLRALRELRIPRCYDYEPTATRELHTFVDASEEAYVAAAYWRIQRADGSVKITLAMAKSRVAPIKPTSIPRLELQAAVLGTRISNTTRSEHDYEDITRRVFWSDSRTVLAWIRAEPRTFKTFVAHRLAEIEESTKKSEWRWVPTAENVADDATRATPHDFDAQHRWFNGPEFLRHAEEHWPTENKEEVPKTGEEKESCAVVSLGHAHLPDIERFSRWTRLIRVTARVLQFVSLCRANKHATHAARRKRTRENAPQDGEWKNTARAPTTNTKKKHENTPRRKYKTVAAEHLIHAERLWIEFSQRECFDFAHTGTEKLKSLSTYTDDYGILRLKGRIAATDAINEETANPAVLDGKHRYTRLYIQHVHEQLHHGGTEIVVNELRQRLWIIKIRPTVKNVVKSCLTCRMKKAKPSSPATGDLPAARLAHHVRPFTYTGLDYFGPLEVTVGRHREKRYVALYTCMTTRAVHLEVAASLSADSTIATLRRLIARRGCPTELWSDNATGFKAADKELTEVATEALQEEAARRHIMWRFIPPASPFMGGAWERMVRTVKDALRATLHEKYPSDETLSTLLAEVESTVNSRPLTHVAVSPDDPVALTPNLLLIGPNCHVPTPGTFSEEDDHARQHWRRAQRLADVFWQRWMQEYLPLLQHRREPHSTGSQPKIGDLVIVCDSNNPRNTWPRGRVTAVHPGKDNIVRVVDITTSNGHVLRRPTKRIVVLPIESQDSDGGRMFTTKIPRLRRLD
ncbi:unnamed protein product [Plutella xylostella]|uniref:(diamondback moth) hypothetical protein n=1 Tax=Plutella xylostella TaxID=51655 RepID=A0A8S4DRL5_PLUXY|nr:unnamed protein product [Plutella xylostella]